MPEARAATADGGPALHLVRELGDPPAERHLRVLVLEDHPFQRRMLVRVLLAMGDLEVDEAATGDEALVFVRERAPDVVFTDLETPGTDGVTFLRMLGQERRGTAVVLTSAHDHAVLRSVDEMARLHGLRVLGAVPKPLSADVVRRLVGDVRHASPSPARTGGPAGRVFTADEVAAAIARVEVIPWFQPKVEVASGRVTGVEALARWQHPELGVLGAGRFVPVIEETPVCDALSDVILEATLQALVEWREHGLDLSASVNLPGGALTDPSLADTLVRKVRRAGVEPTSLVVEVTETTVSRERALTIETLARLRLAGFGLSLDDYGTGYASMEMLKTMPFTEVKVDRRFVHEASADPKATAVLTSLLELASGLGLTAVAEGVEREEDYQLLLALDCPLAQGFVIAPPMSGADFLPWSRQRNSRAR